jgi:hypothetical protein
VETFITSFGLPGAVILALVGTLLWIVRKIVTGDLVPRAALDRERERGELYRQANDKLTDALREVVTDKDLGLHMLASLRAQAQANRGDDP